MTTASDSLSKIGKYAHLAELVDALVLGTSDFGRGSSSLPVGIPSGVFFMSIDFWLTNK